MTTGNAAGVSFFPTIADFTTRTRSHAGLSHYQRVKQRPNYHLLAEHSVSQILFEGKKAVGVEYLPTAGGSVSTATAKKEVILASGAIHTPKILQLSGVGPRKLLERLGIKVVVDLPGVGSNFHDQPSMIIPYNGESFFLSLPSFTPIITHTKSRITSPPTMDPSLPTPPTPLSNAVSTTSTDPVPSS